MPELQELNIPKTKKSIHSRKDIEQTE